MESTYDYLIASIMGGIVGVVVVPAVTPKEERRGITADHAAAHRNAK
jgi:hypothetical protein